MPEQPVVIQKISWSDLCPWTIIFRTLPIASSFTVLALALVGVLVTPVGWWACDWVFLNEEIRSNEAFLQVVETNNSPYKGVFVDLPDAPPSLELWGMRINGPREVFRQYVHPFQNIFHRGFGVREFLYFLVGALWTVAIWGFLALAIARVALVRLTRNEFVSMDEAIEFAVQKWSTAITAIAVPLIGVAALCIPAALLGLLMTFDLGLGLVGVLWFLVIGLCAIMGVLLFGLMFGWPLMVSSVACESQNAFDAMTRSYAYTFQRPLHYLFYAIVAILFGGLCWMIVAAFADGVVGLTFWTTSWGANSGTSDRMASIVSGVTTESQTDAPGGAFKFGRQAIDFWNGFILSIAAAFLYGLFWCMASAVYLLLRKDVDETEMDEILIREEERSYQLPPLQSDENGIPQVRPTSLDLKDNPPDDDSTEPTSEF